MTRGGEAEDVEAYVVARWSDLVRSLVDLGAPVARAEDVARRACARTWRAWSRERRTGDVDVLVFGELLSRWGWPQAHPDVSADRVAQVLVTTGRLSEHAAERISGGEAWDAPTDPWAPGVDGGTPYTGVAPVAALRVEVRRRRRRTASVVVAAALVAAMGVGLARVLEAGPDRPDRRPEVANPLPLAWWSQGVLHLGRSRVGAPDVVELEQAGDGESYAVLFLDRRGGIYQVDDATDPVLVGRTEPGSGIRATTEGRAAWVEVGEGAPAVVVWDVAGRRVLDRLPLADPGGPAEVLALDGDTVYLRTPRGAGRWVLGEDAVSPVADRVVAASDGVRVVTAPTARSTDDVPVLAGRGRFTVDAGLRATLSPGGLITATWVPGRPDLALTGRGATLATVPLQLPERTGISEARFAPSGELVLVLTGGAGTDRAARVATCVLHTGACDEVVRVAAGPSSVDGSAAVLLAQ